jgi:glycosyltransferase involved in cell wall biosynthesis
MLNFWKPLPILLYPYFMTIAVLHNYYQHRGGEDTVFEAEARLLEERGHRVIRYAVHNDSVGGYSQLQLARATVWNPETYKALTALFRTEKPDVVHCHNTLPIISPSAYTAANDAGIPVVQTLHNYRLLCPNALFFRDGHVCEDCLGKTFALPAVVHKCYRGSMPASAVVAGMTAWHRMIGTWEKRVSRYIALTEFARAKFIEGGLPKEKIVVKPNFVETDAGFAEAPDTRNYALYVGRLSKEKGLMTALEAWRLLDSNTSAQEFHIIGEGPMEEEARAFVAQHSLDSVRFLGSKPFSEVLETMKIARMLLFPSLLYETFGKSMVEAFSGGTPVIASHLGALAEVVSDGRTGFHFAVGNAQNLAECIQRMNALSPQEYAIMRRAARAEYEAHYTAEANMRLLENIYADCIGL